MADPAPDTHDGDLIETLSILYELSLTIGRSLDFDGACRDFLIPLMSRKNLSHAAVWRCDANDNRLAWAVPQARPDVGDFAPTTAAETGRPEATTAGAPGWEVIAAAHDLDDGEGAIFPLPGIGVLAVRRGVEGRRFDYASLAQLQPLMDQFAISLQAADAFRRSQEERVWLDLLFDAVTDGIVVCEPDGRIVRMNDRMTTWAKAAHEATFLCDLAGGPGPVRDAVGRLGRAEEGSRILVDASEVIDPYGNTRTLAWSMVSASIAGQRQIIASAADVSNWQSRADELQMASEASDAANLAKSQFLSRVSHELRTPLNAVLGFTELAAMTEIGSETADWLDRVLVAGRHLLTLIDDVLDVSRVEAGEMTLNVEPVKLCEVVHDSLPMVLARAEELGIQVEAVPPANAPDVLVDPVRARQVIVNLMSNAVKFNRSGGSVILHCDISEDFASVSVTDTGYGIAEHDLDRLFVPFDRLGQERGEVEGTGIGLSLSRAMASAMGGSLTATSTVGVGSTFVFSMPLARGRGRGEISAIGPIDVAKTTPDTGLSEAA